MKKKEEEAPDGLMLLAFGYLFGGLLAGGFYYGCEAPRMRKHYEQIQEQKRTIEREQFREATGEEKL